MEIINTKLLGHPLNWFIVGSMLAIWGYVLHAARGTTNT